MRGLPLSQVRITDLFWSRYQQLLIDTTLPAQYEQLVQTGRLENFKRAARAKGEFQGVHCFNDSDVYKYIEACAYALATTAGNNAGRDQVRRQMDDAIATVIPAQEPTGYINTFFQLKHPQLKWRNLGSMHEMYCGGHLIEAAVALHESLGDRRLLGMATKFADHVMDIFGPGRRLGYPGHEEIELALIRLAGATGEVKYREFARWLVEQRGRRPSPIEAELDDAEAMAISAHAPRFLRRESVYVGDYAQDHAPIREHTEVVGHAVRAMYLYIAAADLADGRDDEKLESALESAWTNLTQRRMYVTGGIGPSSSNEGFTADFDLPNLTAYAETCAACGLVFWGHRMLEMTGVGDYADAMERALYNGVISGISLDGVDYFYDNPLESRGRHRRTPWFPCACCPPNVARLIGSLGAYVAGASEDAFYIHLPVGLQATFSIGGVAVEVEIAGNYPWSGKFEIRLKPTRPVSFALHVRIPDWSDEVDSDLPEAEEEATYESGYAVFDREWRTGEVLTIDFGVKPKWVEADPRVRDNLGRAALMYGPLVYCAEETDLGFAPQLFVADVDAEIVTAPVKQLEGVTTLTVEGVAEIESFPDALYAELGTTETREASATLIPYYAWANRGAGSMLVWFRTLQ